MRFKVFFQEKLALIKQQSNNIIKATTANETIQRFQNIVFATNLFICKRQQIMYPWQSEAEFVEISIRY